MKRSCARPENCQEFKTANNNTSQTFEESCLGKALPSFGCVIFEGTPKHKGHTPKTVSKRTESSPPTNLQDPGPVSPCHGRNMQLLVLECGKLRVPHVPIKFDILWIENSASHQMVGGEFQYFRGFGASAWILSIYSSRSWNKQ